MDFHSYLNGEKGQIISLPFSSSYVVQVSIIDQPF